MNLAHTCGHRSSRQSKNARFSKQTWPQKSNLYRGILAPQKRLVNKILFHRLPNPQNTFSQAPRPKNSLSQAPRPKNYLSQAPCRKKCSFTASPLHKNTLSQPCINLLVGTISFRSLGEHSLVGTFAFLHSDHWSEISLLAHWAQISLSVHWAEISLRQHRLAEQLSSPCSIKTHGCPGKRAAFRASQWLSKSATIA